MTLVLVRHGETAWNAERRMQGRTDNALSPTGTAQARAAARELGGRRPEAVIASPLIRARQTAGVIALHLGSADVGIDDDLAECDFGDAEGMPVATVHERWPDGEYPGAEPLAAVAERGARALARHSGTDTIVVAHGVLLRAALELLTGAPVERILTSEHLLLHDDCTLVRPVLEELRRGSCLLGSSCLLGNRGHHSDRRDAVSLRHRIRLGADPAAPRRARIDRADGRRGNEVLG